MERRFLIYNFLFLSMVGGVVLWLFPALFKSFSHNPTLNGLIIGCLFIGIAANFINFYKISREKKWLGFLEKGTHQFPGVVKPRLLHSLLNITNEQGFSLSQSTVDAACDAVDSRLSETRDLGRYLTGLLIFLGLLGTFWGLSQTVGAIANVIGTLKISSNDIAKTFEGLKDGLQSPLNGMGTAFSSSMFGLAGSLILGFMDMQVVKLLNDFSRMIESVMNRFVRADITSMTGMVGGGTFSQVVVEQTTENLHLMTELYKKTDDQRSQMLKVMIQLTERVAQLSEHLSTHHHLFKRLLLQQEKMEIILSSLDQHSQDDVIKQHLRNLDATVSRLTDDLIQGRQTITHELKSEIRMVTRTISALANQEAA